MSVKKQQSKLSAEPTPSIVPSSEQPTSPPPPGHPHHIPPYLRDYEKYLGRIVSIGLHAIFFLLLIRFFIIEPGTNDGTSMEPTMKDNTFFVVEKITPLFTPLHRFDVVQLFDPHDKNISLVKRIIGLPGETVIFNNNAVYIRQKDGSEQKLSEPYLRADVIDDVPYGAPREIRVPDYSYFVLGDNRPVSRDSRAIGSVHRNLITGKVYPITLH